jgi:beta-glucosidase
MVDESIGRILKLVERVEEARKTRKALPVEERVRLSVEAAEKSIVLLKNDGVLPLKDKNILLAGAPVESPYVVGGGSAQVQTKKKPSLRDTLQTAIPDATIDYSWLYHASNCLQTPSGQPRVMNVRGVLQKAYDNDVTILVVGNPTNVETESFDRSELKLNPVLEDLILRIAERAQKLVVVVEAGSAIDMSAWIDAVDAVVYTGYVGEYVNVALANVLSGKVNPSGRLSETFPLCVEDSPTGRDRGGSYADFYSEGVLIGYRWYDTLNIPILFPFGYGLSYSEFKYDDFKVEKKRETDYEVSFTIENLSDREGGEVAQLYVRNVDMMVVRPEKELRRFEKVYLKAGEKKKVTFKVEKDCFEYYNVCRGGWTLDGGRYEILVCRDAETIMFRHKVVI